MPSDVGDSVSIAWDVRDANGVLVTATTAVLTITLPDGTTTTPVVPIPSSAGQYRVTYVPSVEGRHVWRAVTTGPSTAYQDVFEVREAVSPALLSLADGKAHLNIPAAVTTHDNELREYLEAVTTVVEQYVGPIVRRTYTRRVKGYQSSVCLPHTQVISVDSIVLVLDGSSPISDLNDLIINSEAGIVRRKDEGPFAFGDTDWTYTVGRTYVQPNWTLAAKMILEYNWESQLGSLPSIQGDSDREYVSRRSLVPPRAALLLHADGAPAGFA